METKEKKEKKGIDIYPPMDPRIYHEIVKANLVTEQGRPYTFHDRKYLLQPLMDISPKFVCQKAAQLGLTLMFFLKQMFFARIYGLDGIYIMPTYTDMRTLVGSKLNRLIMMNKYLQDLLSEKDNMEQKGVRRDDGGMSMLLYRGSFSAKDALSVTSDFNIIDEYSSCDQKVVETYSSRLQATTFKDPEYGTYEWFFGHPDYPDDGVNRLWKISTQNHWFITCSHCGHEQYMSWPESYDLEKEIYICKKCKGEITDDDRRYGEWRPKYNQSRKRPFSGYWFPLHIAPWVSAREIIKEYRTKDPHFFWTKVMGMPYLPSDAVLRREQIMQNVTDRVNDQSGQIIIGVDTGMTTWGVVGNKQGLFYRWNEKGYGILEELMNRFPNAIAIFDAQGDLRKPRELAQKYAGRIKFAWYGNDKLGGEMVKWKDSNRDDIIIDRNRMIQFQIDEMAMGDRIRLHGTESDWDILWRHYKAIYREVEENPKTLKKRVIWKRTGDDHLVHCVNYWRAGIYLMGDSSGGTFI